MEYILKFLSSHSEKLMAAHPREPWLSIVIFVPWFLLLLVDHPQLSYFWASDLYPASPVLLFYLMLLPQSHHQEFMSLKNFLCLTSLTVPVTYRPSEDQCLRMQWLCKAMFPSLSTQVSCLVGAVRPSPGGRLLSGQSPWLLLTSCSPDGVLSFSQFIFQKWNVLLCFLSRNVYYDVEYVFSNSQHPTLRITAVTLSLCHPRTLLVPLSFFWRHLLLLSVTFLHPSFRACYTTNIYHIYCKEYWGIHLK